MAIQLQVRRGTTAQNDAFTGAVGELSVNTDTSAIRVHDGATAGGVELARSSQIDSLLVKSVAGAVDVTLSAGEAGNSNHEYTGILTGDINVIVPAASHNFTAENLTTGAYTLTVKTAAGAGVLIPQGKALQLYCNGTDVEDSNSAKANDAEVAKLAGATFTGPVLFDTVADIASATSIDLTEYGSGFIATVTGTTPTTTFVMSDGQFGTLVAEGAWPLTNTADTCEVLGGNFTAAADDQFTVTKTGGVVRVFPHSLASRAKTTADLRGTSKVISFSRDMTAATGSVDVTGFGGTPVSCDVVAFLAGTPRFSNGFCASDLSQGCMLQSYTGNMTNAAAVAFLIEAAGKNQTAVVASFSADTVTLNWTRNGVTGAGTATGYIIARF